MRTGRPRGFDRDKALEACVELFWKQGFEGTSKRDLMEATGVASQSLYNAFGDKRSLFWEALQHYANTIFADLEAMLQSGPSPLAGVRTVVRSWGEEELCGCLLANSAAERNAADTELREFLQAQMGRAVEMIVAALAAARDQGELPPSADPRQLAMTLFAIRGGLALMTRSEVPQATLDQAVEGALQLLQ